MADSDYVLALDQGTGSTKAVAISVGGVVVDRASVPLTVESPVAGWVEQDPAAILASVVAAAEEIIGRAGHPPAALALSTQRESALAWDSATGEPLSPLLGWQDRRTSQRAAELVDDADRVRALSGLPLDPMFSALKFEWILDKIDPNRSRARHGALRLGTVDAFLIARLTGQDQIEVGNASRTQLVNVANACWDEELCTLFGIPQAALPPVVASDASPRVMSMAIPSAAGVPVAAVLGDSHAALFAHTVHDPAAIKATYGTGSSIMGLTPSAVRADSGLAHTIGWQRGGVVRAFEGNILATGATLIWLSSLLGLTPEEVATLATTVPDSAGIDVVPAFAGLGAPWWDTQAVGLISGFALGTTSAHVARAAMEAIVLQVEDVLDRADSATGTTHQRLYADGGPAMNDWLMQRQADLSNRTVLRAATAGSSVVGAGTFAGLVTGLLTEEQVRATGSMHEAFHPVSPGSEQDRRDQWRASVERSRYRPLTQIQSALKGQPC